jgi:hypothetical protein
VTDKGAVLRHTTRDNSARMREVWARKSPAARAAWAAAIAAGHIRNTPLATASGTDATRASSTEE